jgi:ribonuclease HI
MKKEQKMMKLVHYFEMGHGEPSVRTATVLISPSKIKTCYAAKFESNCTNNIVEYEDLLLGLWKFKAMGIRRAILKTDSQVIFGSRWQKR